MVDAVDKAKQSLAMSEQIQTEAGQQLLRTCRHREACGALFLMDPEDQRSLPTITGVLEELSVDGPALKQYTNAWKQKR